MCNWVQIRPNSVPPVPTGDFYYSEDNWQEFLDLCDSIWSVQFQDSGKRFKFTYGVYIWNRTALDFNWMYMNTVNLDTLSYTTKSLNYRVTSRVWNLWNNRILTNAWIVDYDWETIQSFSSPFDSITLGLPWVVRANIGFDIYKGTFSWSNLTFTKIWTSATDEYTWLMSYWHLWAYLFNRNDTTWARNSSYVNPSDDSITTIETPNSDPWSSWWRGSRYTYAYSWQDWCMYRKLVRLYWWWALEKVSNTYDSIIGYKSLSTSWNDYWVRSCKFLWNIVAWWMNRVSNTWVGYWSDNYYIDSNGATVVQSNALAYDSTIIWFDWFIDENWRIYPYTSWWWDWVILKTDKTFTNLNWKNPYLWR